MGEATYTLNISDTMIGYAIWHLGRVLGLVKVVRSK